MNIDGYLSANQKIIMTTVINTPGGDNSGSGAGLVIGIVIALIVIVLIFVYGIPAIRGNRTTNVNVTVPNPAQNSGGGGYTQP